MWDILFLIGTVIGVSGIMATWVFGVDAGDIARWWRSLK